MCTTALHWDKGGIHRTRGGYPPSSIRIHVRAYPGEVYTI